MKWYALAIAGISVAGWAGTEFLKHQAEPPPPAVTVRQEVPPDPEAIELVRAGLGREQSGDSAAARSAYLQAAASLAPIGDYLRLRAVALTSDSADRASLYRRIESDPARERIPVTEARVRERMGDLTGAIERRSELGQWSDVFRLRILAAPGHSDRAGVLRDLVAQVRDTSTSIGVRAAVTAAAVPHLQDFSAPDLLALARASVAGGLPPQAVMFFSRASQRGARLTSADRLDWGKALFALGRYREVAAELRRVAAGPSAPEAMLLRGRAQLRLGQRSGKVLLEELVRRYPADSVAGPVALFLLGDLARDANDYVAARRRWVSVYQRFPASDVAPRARFLAALVWYGQGRVSAAAAAWDSLFQADAGREEALAAGYWAGRAWSAVGDSARAQDRWREVSRRSALSYYSRLAYRRLGVADSTIVAGGRDSFETVPPIEAARSRLMLLELTGLDAEIGMEITWLAGNAGEDLSRVLATADLLRTHGRTALASQLGWRAFTAGAKESRTYRLIFSLQFDSVLVHAARRSQVEPALVAALIRQESLFDTSVTSRAGARGLMQIMPSVGRELARKANRRSWHPDSLYQAATNLELGSAHLAWALERYGGLEPTLAAYNAGGSRVNRWAKYPGSPDPELFVEWIPFPETRTYVRTVGRNLEFYRGLYNWK